MRMWAHGSQRTTSGVHCLPRLRQVLCVLHYLCQASWSVTFWQFSSLCLSFPKVHWYYRHVLLWRFWGLKKDDRLCNQCLYLTVSQLSSLSVNIFNVLRFHCHICALTDLLILFFIWYEKSMGVSHVLCLYSQRPEEYVSSFETGCPNESSD